MSRPAKSYRADRRNAARKAGTNAGWKNLGVGTLGGMRRDAKLFDHFFKPKEVKKGRGVRKI